jgi:hypothetical protein
MLMKNKDEEERDGNNRGLPRVADLDMKNPLELSRWVLVLNLLDTTVLCDSRKAMIDSQVIVMAAAGVSCLT